MHFMPCWATFFIYFKQHGMSAEKALEGSIFYKDIWEDSFSYYGMRNAINSTLKDSGFTPLEKFERVISMVISENAHPLDKVYLIKALVSHYFGSTESCKDLVKLSKGYYKSSIR
jgi:hypothetical protein